jgi:hypothetical protein
MTERLRVAEHRGDRRDRLVLHAGRRRAAIEGVVVGVEQHRGGVGGPRQRMGRLEHLADVVGVAIGVGVGEALDERVERLALGRCGGHRVGAQRPERRELLRPAREPCRELRREADIAGVHQAGTEVAGIAGDSGRSRRLG